VNILGRQADATGLANWVAMLNGGASRGQVLIGLANSTEAVNRLAPTIRTFLSYDTFLNAAADPGRSRLLEQYLTTLDDQFRATICSPTQRLPAAASARMFPAPAQRRCGRRCAGLF